MAKLMTQHDIYGITTAENRSSQRVSIKRAVQSICDKTEKPVPVHSTSSLERANNTRRSLQVDNILNDGLGMGCVSDLRIKFNGFKDDCEASRLRDIEVNAPRNFADRVAKSTSFQMVVAFFILGHVGLGIYDTDLRAEGRGLPEWYPRVESIIVCMYIIELTLRIYVTRLGFFLELWNLFEAFLVLTDLFMMVSAASGGVSLLRSIRLLRVFRVLNKFLVFREVYLMVRSVGSACRTLGFGAIIAFMVMTSLSVLAVEILHPLMAQLTAKGYWADCERCQRAFSSVMTANITFFKIILAGDSWGQICVPLIEHYTEAAIVLVFIFLTIQIGVVNIIIAVLVDRIQESRVDDESLRKAVKEEKLKQSYRQLWKVFRSIDTSGDGSLSIDELVEAYNTNHVFKNIMNMMDFTTENIDIFFDILDKNHDGEITYEEFVEQLHAMRVFDSHTLLVIIKHLVEGLQGVIDERVDSQGVLEERIDGEGTPAQIDPQGVLDERVNGAETHAQLDSDGLAGNRNMDFIRDVSPWYTLYSGTEASPRPSAVIARAPDACKPDEDRAQHASVEPSQRHVLCPVDETPPTNPFGRSTIEESTRPSDWHLDTMMYDKMLEYIDAVEADMCQIIDTVELSTEDCHPVLFPTGGANGERDMAGTLTPDSWHTMEAFKQSLKQQISQLKQLKPCVQNCVSSVSSWYHLREDAPLAPRATMDPSSLWDNPPDLEPMVLDEDRKYIADSAWFPNSLVTFSSGSPAPSMGRPNKL